jgi:hypothetical protein
MILQADPGGVSGHLHDVIEHHSFLLGNRSDRVVVLQGLDQFFIKRDSTQKLCVRLDSVMAPVGHRYHRGDHLVLAAAEREIG